LGTVLPASSVGADVSAGAGTVFSADTELRFVTRRGAAQSFADGAVSQPLGRTVAHAQAHCLATGLTFRP
jgi:hypothetical protein